VDNLNILQLNEDKLRNGIIEYAQLDCKILYLILMKFNSLIFDLYNLNINNYPTLPSLAFGIFRSKYLSKNTVPLITGQLFKDINQSYTGESTEFILPYGENLFYYDINSLYPYSMLKNNMPLGNIKAFEGDIFKKDPKALGFFEAIINTPNKLNIPVLQIHNNNKTISPLGRFKGWFFSEELKFARDNFGYNFEILRGYTFDDHNILHDYVNDLYNLRLQYDKSHPMNFIAKILMNSVYGRFGLKPILNEFIIIDKDDLDDFIDTSDINELFYLENKILLSFLDKNKINNNLQKSIASSEDIKSNIAVARAVTAYSRIVLSEIKKFCLDNNIKIFYFDTDSIFIDQPLPENLISKNIGQWKLEATIKEAVFIAPKVSGYIDNNGQEVVKFLIIYGSLIKLYSIYFLH